ncbi:unnamed protein product, partial [Allacma fusca]
LHQNLLNREFGNTNTRPLGTLPNSDDFVPPKTTAREILRFAVLTRLGSKLVNSVIPSDTNLISDTPAVPVTGSIVELNGIPIETYSQLDGININTPCANPPNYVSISSVFRDDPVISNISSDTMLRFFGESNYYAPTNTTPQPASVAYKIVPTGPDTADVIIKQKPQVASISEELLQPMDSATTSVLLHSKDEDENINNTTPDLSHVTFILTCSVA